MTIVAAVHGLFRANQLTSILPVMLAPNGQCSRSPILIIRFVQPARFALVETT
jgi:hypothetical protein